MVCAKAEFEKRQNELLVGLQDTGADVWDGVINNVVLAVPRKYMWFGSHRKDGAEKAINLLFPYKTKDGAQISIAGVLGGNLVERFNCVGFEDETCTSSAAQNSISGYRNCSRQYKGRWRRTCLIVDGFYKKGTSVLNSSEDPIFDEEVQMWRIGLSGYYEGTPEFPTYSLDCGKPGTAWAREQLKPRCKSAAHINDNLYIYYTFPQREGFWEHREINKMVEEKVTSFIVKE